MPISYEHNCIFIHIPKTGGTTIERSMGIGKPSVKNYKCGRTRIFHYLPSLDTDVAFSLQHLPASVIRDLKQDTFSSFFKFSFVRNPYDRIISEFCWVNRGTQKINTFLNNPNFMYKEFDDWVKCLLKVPYGDHLLQQHYFLYDEDTLLVDNIYKYENFQDSLKELSEKLNFVYDKDLHAYKRKFDIDRERALTDSVKSKIYDIYAEDFERFNYEK